MDSVRFAERRNLVSVLVPSHFSGSLPVTKLWLRKDVLLHAAKLGHGTDSFTSPPKEGMLRIFTLVKIQRLRLGLNPQTWVPEASMLTTRPPNPSSM